MIPRWAKYTNMIRKEVRRWIIPKHGIREASIKLEEKQNLKGLKLGPHDAWYVFVFVVRHA